MSRNDRGHRAGLCATLLLFFAGFGFLALRTWQLHLGTDARVTRRALHQTDREIILTPQRGTIYDNRGRALAVNLQVPSVFADPKLVSDPASFARQLAPILRISPREILSKIRDRSKRFVWLSRKVDPSLTPALKQLDLAGFGVLQEGMRLYPGRELAAQVMGLVGSDGEGLEGLERFYDRYLRSRRMIVKAEQDRRHRPIFSNDTVVLEPEPGADLYLTLDSVIQHIVEKELAGAARASRTPRATAVVIDPSDGRILAMASYPPINPNRTDHLAAENLRNRSVEEIYEPGSTFKLFAIAAALEEPSFSVGQRVPCMKGSLRLNGKTIRSHVPHQWLTPREVLKFSDNIGMSRIALKIGPRAMYTALKRLGFGNATGVDFPGEANGMLSPYSKWRDVDLANISFGQGVGTTVLQIASAVSAIANGGIWVRPYLVEKARFADGRELIMRNSQAAVRVLSPRTAEVLSGWMEEVTASGGTGATAKIPGYRTAGKTGTAQKIDPVTHNYSDRRVVSSFAGFAPASNPKVAAIFVFDDPPKGDFGAVLAGPVFRDAMEAILTYLNVPPDDGTVEQASVFPQADEIAEEEPAQAQAPAQDADLLPDVRGLTVREVLTRTRHLSIDVKVTGSGVAVRQMPEPGQAISKVRRLEVFFDKANRKRGST
ncbi:MAG: penicillin-binding protein [Pseudomonadota bacterium]